MERFRRTEDVLERARHEGFPVTFHVSKNKSRRWNWVLTVHYVEKDPLTDEQYVEKAVLRTSKTREPLDALKERLEATINPPPTPDKDP